ncbi:MAG: hypothetical protein ACTJLM_00075 [Ehrlichia sp.]
MEQAEVSEIEVQGNKRLDELLRTLIIELGEGQTIQELTTDEIDQESKVELQQVFSSELDRQNLDNFSHSLEELKSSVAEVQSLSDRSESISSIIDRLNAIFQQSVGKVVVTPGVDFFYTDDLGEKKLVH